jgi:diguanylate cyclase (GGDEF)-like protein
MMTPIQHHKQADCLRRRHVDRMLLRLGPYVPLLGTLLAYTSMKQRGVDYSFAILTCGSLAIVGTLLCLTRRKLATNSKALFLVSMFMLMGMVAPWVKGFNTLGALSFVAGSLTAAMAAERKGALMYCGLVLTYFVIHVAMNPEVNGLWMLQFLAMMSMMVVAGIIIGDIVGSLRETVVDLSMKNEEALMRAERDRLTGAYNRKALEDHLGRLARATQSHPQNNAYVLFMDLDGFKAINDRHGHNVGDEALIAASQRIQAALRSTDMFARFGGDEFVAVVDLTDATISIEVVLYRILEAMNTPFSVGDGLAVSLGVSIGVTELVVQHEAATVTSILDRADRAMYQAKWSGKNRFVVYGRD